jgi:DNA polymerase I
LEQYNAFIYGACPLEGIVCVEPHDGYVNVFREGKSEPERHPHSWWALSSQKRDSGWVELQGQNHYRFRRYYPALDAVYEDRRENPDLWMVHDKKEHTLIGGGYTYYKGLKLPDVSVLGFDIEATTLDPDSDQARVLLISNTFRNKGTITRKLFACDDYASDKAMFEAWCAWVRDQDPSIVVGHNIYGYDLPYIAACAHRAGAELHLGRGHTTGWTTKLRFNNYFSKYRRDGSQFYTYRNASIYGREIVDTFFLAMKYDVARKYENYGLKGIIKQEGREVEGRQHYDASQIARNWHLESERALIKRYAEHDADDALTLFDLMAPAYFYLCQSIPKSFQHVINSASGSWLNAFLVRSYLQDGFGIPKETEGSSYEGAISIGNPGIYRNVFKVDVASLYPSIMLQYQIHDPAKDPRAHFQRMVQHFTTERLSNKRMAKESGDRYFSDLEQAQKIVINSAYGMLGAPGLNFNSPTNAAMVTKHGRDILTMAIDWARDIGMLKLVNADTDSISVANDKPWTDGARAALLNCLNNRSPERVRWEDDGTYDSVVVLKAKNYALKQGSKIKIKGSALKATLKEPRLRQFIADVIERLTETESGNGSESVQGLYQNVAREIMAISDIALWCTKKTITDKVLNPTRTNESKVLDAIEGQDVQMGDKVYLYFAIPAPGQKKGPVKRREDWSHDHCTSTLLRKLHDTICIFDSVLPIEQFPNYALKKNRQQLHALIRGAQPAEINCPAI